jgi:cytochrome c
MRIFAIVTIAGLIGIGPAVAQQGGMMPGGQGGMMQPRHGETPNLKQLPPERTVQGVKYCNGQYLVNTAAGDVLEFSEFNLRLKTDTSDRGPVRGKPALLPAGMMGDRGFLVFSDPGEISEYIEKQCS